MNTKVVWLMLLGLSLTSVMGCGQDQSRTSPNVAAIPKTVEPVPEGPTVASTFKLEPVLTPWPDTAVSKDQAMKIASDWCSKKWRGNEVTKSSTWLSRQEEKLIWPVVCTIGHTEIAGFDVTAYINAANGQLLGVHVPSTQVR